MNELRLHVERAVRPIRASVGTKMKMREELLAHLTAIYEEELACGADEATAVARAKDRIGTPAELTAELDATVGRTERWEWSLDRRFGRRPGESDERLLWRVAAFYAVALAFAYMIGPAVSLVARWAGKPGGRFHGEWLSYSREVVPVLLWVQVNFTVLAFLVLRIARQQRAMRVAVLGAAAGLCVWATSGILMWFVTGDSAEGIAALLPSHWTVLAIIAAPGMVAVGRLLARERAKLAPWVELELGE